jgi:hypothetical protein
MSMPCIPYCTINNVLVPWLSTFATLVYFLQLLWLQYSEVKSVTGSHRLQADELDTGLREQR